jgi:hypothetical protein
VSAFCYSGPARARCVLLGTILATALAGCFGTQIHPTLSERVISLRPGDLESGGIAFITPSTVTGQEQEKQAVALIFAESLKQKRPQTRVVGLAETLGEINKANLAQPYKRMYDDYRDTGLFASGILEKIGDVTGARYVAQLKLQRFNQGAKERFGAFGLRIVETKFANVRLFLQVWDTGNGTIAWEGMEEMLYATDKIREGPVTLQAVIDRAAEELVARLP